MLSMSDVHPDRTDYRLRNTANRLARHILWFRDLRGYTQEGLARRAGLDPSAVVRAESGQAQMTLRTLLLLADALDTSPGVLLGCVERSAEVLAADAARRRF